MDRAEPRRAPISPNPRRDWLTAILAGLTVAFGLAFGIEYLDDTIKTPEDVTRRLKLPLLGLVPALRGGRVPVLTETVPHDFGEAFRSLRTSLVFTSGSESTRVMAVTSSQPLEGKTTTACNLAMALALGGSRVLLIDADLRRPGLHKTMGLQNGAGLSHLLVGQARVREVDPAHGGPEPVRDHRRPDAAEPVGAARVRADESFHRQPGARTVRLGRDRHAAGARGDRRGDPRAEGGERGVRDWLRDDAPGPCRARARDAAERHARRNIGVVLNRVDFDRNKYYYSRYYGYQYKSYYGQPPAS